MSHKPVLLKQIIDGLCVSSGDTIVDMTVGNGGHLVGILNTGVKKISALGIDADQSAIDNTEKNLKKILSDKNTNHKIFLETAYYDLLPEILEKYQIKKVDKFIFDLGFRSDQVDDSKRGFSFLKEGPLDMSFSLKGQNKVLSTKSQRLTAEIIVNEWQEQSIADIIYGFGEEKFARKIARAIVERREDKKICTTTELAEIIKSAVPPFYRRSKIHPATKTFQAIRIAVNSELDRLQRVLPIAFELLNKNGRIAVISFHSLEDRIVKIFFKEKVANDEAVFINKKPIIPTREELSENPRSRSAKLRIIQKQ